MTRPNTRLPKCGRAVIKKGYASIRAGEVKQKPPVDARKKQSVADGSTDGQTDRQTDGPADHSILALFLPVATWHSISGVAEQGALRTYVTTMKYCVSLKYTSCLSFILFCSPTNLEWFPLVMGNLLHITVRLNPEAARHCKGFTWGCLGVASELMLSFVMMFEWSIVLLLVTSSNPDQFRPIPSNPKQPQATPSNRE